MPRIAMHHQCALPNQRDAIHMPEESTEHVVGLGIDLFVEGKFINVTGGRIGPWHRAGIPTAIDAPTQAVGRCLRARRGGAQGMFAVNCSIGIGKRLRLASDMIVPITDPGGMLLTVMP